MSLPLFDPPELEPGRSFRECRDAEYERRRTAIHEAGHAVAALALGLVVESVTIRPRPTKFRDIQRGRIVRRDGIATGCCYFAPTRKRTAVAIACLASTAAERMVYGDIPKGSVHANDLASARREMTRTSPPARLVPDQFKDVPRRFGQAVARLYWLEDLAARAEHIVTANRAAIEALAGALVERETLDAGTLRCIWECFVKES